MKPSWLVFVLLVPLLAACNLIGTVEEDEPEIPGKIVFAADDDKTSQIYTMNADGSNVKKLTDFPAEGGAADPAWSPDGTKIAYQVCTNCELGGGNYEISVVEVAGEDYDPDQVHAVTDHPASDTNPSWSPDGSKIAFVSNRDYIDADSMHWRKDLYVMDAGDSNLQRLTEVGFVGSISWHPQGNRITFAANKGLFIYDFQTSDVLEFDIELENLRPICWSGNGRYLLLSKTEEYPQDGFYLLDTREDTVKQISFRPKQLLGADWFVPKEN